MALPRRALEPDLSVPAQGAQRVKRPALQHVLARQIEVALRLGTGHVPRRRPGPEPARGQRRRAASARTGAATGGPPVSRLGPARPRSAAFGPLRLPAPASCCAAAPTPLQGSPPIGRPDRVSASVHRPMPAGTRHPQRWPAPGRVAASPSSAAGPLPTGAPTRAGLAAVAAGWHPPAGLAWRRPWPRRPRFCAALSVRLWCLAWRRKMRHHTSPCLLATTAASARLETLSFL
jgi:hypothetical protein